MNYVKFAVFMALWITFMLVFWFIDQYKDGDR